MKKGQGEVVGLVIVVILIVVIGVFAMRFYISSSGQEERTEFYSVKANNLVNAIRLASVCDDDKMENAILACCNNEDFCDRSSRQNCDFIVGEIEEILGDSLEEDAVLEVKDCFFVGDCDFGIASSTFVISSSQGSYEMLAKVCKK